MDSSTCVQHTLNGVKHILKIIVLFQIFYSATELRNVSLNYNPMTIDEFSEMFPTFVSLLMFVKSVYEDTS